MKKKVRVGFVVFVVAGLTAGIAYAQPAGSKTPKASVSLISSTTEVVPGRAFDLGLRFVLADGWHIYWKNSGDSGQPPQVKWTLPTGFEAGDLQFPVPKRHVTAGVIVTNIIEGEPILPIKITPPAAIDTQTVTIGAKVRYLICEKTCLIESADVSVELPVTKEDRAPKEANEKLFKRARKVLPERSSKYVTISPKLDPPELSPGKPFELTLEARIKRGFHIQSNKPSNDAFIACEVFLEPSDGVTFEDPAYPPGKKRRVKYLGELSEYEGKIIIKIPGQLEGDAAAGPRRLAGILKYQACNAKGTCMPPAALAFAVGKDKPTKVGALPEEKPTVVARNLPDETNTVKEATDTSVPEDPEESEAASERSLEDILAALGLPGILLGCFLYGLFMNATPCVLPLLSIKVLGFVQQAHESRARTMLLGLAFGAGVLILFVVLGFLATVGTNILQIPAAVIALGAVVMAMALSMLGVYTLQVPTAATKLDATIQKEGIFSSLGKGALAPVLGFACTGPLMAGMFGWATQQEPKLAFLAFLVTGAGMASPYVILGANPGWLSFLPKPGNWMITFERVMGFLLLAMVIWLLHPLVTQIGSAGLEWTLGFFVVVAMSCWLLGKIDFNMSSGTRWTYRGSAAALTVGSAALIFGWIYPIDEAKANAALASSSGGHSKSGIPWQLWSPPRGDPSTQATRAIQDFVWERGIPWQRWSPSALEEAVDAGKCAFVDFTAAYCTVCKANKAAATNTQQVRAKIRALDIIPFQGDYTTGDDEIFALLQKHERPGVPLNLIYPPGRPDAPVVLRPQLTKGYLLEKIDEVCGAPMDTSETTASRSDQ